MTFDERVAAMKAQTTYATRNDLFVHPVRTNRTDRTIGHFPSQVMMGSLPFHSELERVLVNILDFTIGVSEFLSQSQCFDWSDGERLRRYTPDCGVKADGRCVMIETKLEEDAWSPENIEVRELSAPFLKKEGWDLLLVTDAVLFHDDLLRNIRTIRRRRGHPWNAAAIRTVRQALKSDGPLTFAECVALSATAGGDADLLYAAIGKRKLYCNLWEPLTGASILIHPDFAPRPFVLELLGE
jgi:hypothetical protein